MTAISENTIRQLDESLGNTNNQGQQSDQSNTKQQSTKKEATKPINTNRSTQEKNNKQGQKMKQLIMLAIKKQATFPTKATEAAE